MNVILTGHSQGLGAALADQLLDKGHRVLGISRRKNDRLQERHPESLIQVQIDLSNVDELIGWLSKPQMQQFFKADAPACLINNAGIIDPIGKVGTHDAQMIAKSVSLNVSAALILTDRFLRCSATAPERRLLQISSGAARSPYAGWSVYCATKAALDQHAKCLALEEHPRLRACSLAPGLVDTAMQDKVRQSDPEQFPMLARFKKAKAENQIPSADDAAKKIVAYLLSESFGAQTCVDMRELNS